jgi:hypothetical protein
MKTRMKRKSKRTTVLAVLIAVSMFVNTVLVVSSVQYTFHQWVGDQAIEELEWVSRNLTSSNKPMIFVIHGSMSTVADYIELWRRVIGSFIPSSLVYVGRIDDLLLLREPRSNITKLQIHAEEYWNEIRAQVKYPENLTSIEVVVLSYFYQPITKLELDTQLTQVHDGVYIVNNYTATNRVTLFGDSDYSSIKGPWKSLARDWASFGMVLEIYANVSTDFFATYTFYLRDNANYTFSVSVFDASPACVPVTVMVDNDQIMLITYSGTNSSRTYNSTRIFLVEGDHTLKISPALNGSLFLDLDYIEINMADS